MTKNLQQILQQLNPAGAEEQAEEIPIEPHAETLRAPEHIAYQQRTPDYTVYMYIGIFAAGAVLGYLLFKGPSVVYMNDPTPRPLAPPRFELQRS